MNPEELLHIICDNSLPKRLLVRVDAGSIKGLSFGHLSRCLVLAKALKRISQAKIQFVMRDYPDGVEYAIKNGVEVYTIPLSYSCKDHDDCWLKKTSEFQADWTFLDLPYPIDFSEICLDLRKQGSKILFIDDARFSCPEVDVYLNSSILSPQKILKHSLTKFLLGPEYFIFAPKCLVNAVKKESGHKFHIVLSFGGSDPSGLGFRVIKAIEGYAEKEKMKATLILGPGFKEMHKGIISIMEQKDQIHVVDAPENIYEIFLSSDLVICAGGRTLYELYMLGISAFPIASIEHEKPVVKAFLDRGMAVSGMLEWNEHEFLVQFDRLIKEKT